MKQLKHWQDAVNLVLGAWLALSPWVLGHSGETVPTANAVMVGVALIAAALGAILVRRVFIRLRLALQHGRAHTAHRLRRRDILLRAAPVA